MDQKARYCALNGTFIAERPGWSSDPGSAAERLGGFVISLGKPVRGLPGGRSHTFPGLGCWHRPALRRYRARQA